MKIKVKITDNLAKLNPNKTFIEILKIIFFKDKRDKFLFKAKNKMNDYFRSLFNNHMILVSDKEKEETYFKKLKYNIKNYLRNKLVENKGSWEDTYGPNGRMITYSFPIEFVYDDIRDLYEKLDNKSYKEIKNIKKILYKDLKDNLPRILEEISSNLNLYRWKVDIVFMKDVPDLFIIDIGNNNISMTKTSFGEQKHTKIILASLDNKLIKGELLINKNHFLSSELVPVPGIKRGTTNLIKRTMGSLVPETYALRNKKNKFKLLMSSENESFNIDSFADEFRNQDINKVVSNLKNVMGILSYLKDRELSFIPIILISDRVEWKVIITEKNNGSLSGSYEYYSYHYNDSNIINNDEIIKEILSSLDVVFELDGERFENLRDFYDYLKEALDKNETTNEDLIGINETLKLLEY